MIRDFKGSDVGFHPPAHRRRTMGRRSWPVLIAGLALAVCTALTGTMVSIEIAQADTFAFGAGPDGSPLALATFLGVLLAVMGGITAMVVRRH